MVLSMVGSGSPVKQNSGRGFRLSGWSADPPIGWSQPVDNLCATCCAVWIWSTMWWILTPTTSSTLWITVDGTPRPWIGYPYVVAHGGALAE